MCSLPFGARKDGAVWACRRSLSIALLFNNCERPVIRVLLAETRFHKYQTSRLLQSYEGAISHSVGRKALVQHQGIPGTAK
jgi:hypothetical protein